MPIRASAEAFGEQWSKNCQVTMQFRHLGLFRSCLSGSCPQSCRRELQIFCSCTNVGILWPSGHLAVPPGYPFDIMNVTLHFRKRHKQKSPDVAVDAMD